MPPYRTSTIPLLEGVLPKRSGYVAVMTYTRTLHVELPEGVVAATAPADEHG